MDILFRINIVGFVKILYGPCFKSWYFYWKAILNGKEINASIPANEDQISTFMC